MIRILLADDHALRLGAFEKLLSAEFDVVGQAGDANQLLREVAELDALPVGAYNIRANGKSAARSTTAHINIVSKTDKPGIDIIIAPGTKNESVHIPVIISETGLKDLVYNDFMIGENCDVTIVAGCGIDNCGGQDSQHDGVHTFYVGENSKVRYIERHYAHGEGRGKRLMNPTTVVHLARNAQMEMETTQIAGIDDTLRKTTADLQAGASLTVHEKVMTTGTQHAVSDLSADLNGDDCHCNIVSRTVARDQSSQHFISLLNGNAPCTGHTECDSIIMDQAHVGSIPEIQAEHVDAAIIHEAAIGRINDEQLLKLRTLGMTEAEAENVIIENFLS